MKSYGFTHISCPRMLTSIVSKYRNFITLSSRFIPFSAGTFQDAMFYSFLSKLFQILWKRFLQPLPCKKGLYSSNWYQSSTTKKNPELSRKEQSLLPQFANILTHSTLFKTPHCKCSSKKQSAANHSSIFMQTLIYQKLTDFSWLTTEQLARIN